MKYDFKGKSRNFLSICFFIVLSFLNSNDLVGQTSAGQKQIDSLLALIKIDKEDTNKLNHLFNLSLRYSNLGSYDGSILYAKTAIVSCQEIYSKSKNSDVKFIAKKIEGASYNCMGNSYFFQGNYPDALKYYLEGLKIREEIGDKQGIAISYDNIGGFYTEQNDYDKAIINHRKALKINESIGDKQGIAGCYNNIGNVYLHDKNFEEALKNFNSAKEMNIELGNMKWAAINYNNIGNLYYDQGNYDEALKNYSISLAIRDSLGNKLGIASSNLNIGAVLGLLKKFPEAKMHFLKAIDIAKEIGEKKYLRNAYNSLSELNVMMGDYKAAYENNNLFFLYRDSLDNEKTRKKTIENQLNFDFEKKEAVATAEHKMELEKQSALADEKSRKQKIVLFLVSGFGLLILFFAGFIFRSLRTVRNQKIEIENQKDILEEKQKEVMDSIHYAKRIQQSLMPTEKYIDRELKKLKKD